MRSPWRRCAPPSGSPIRSSTKIAFFLNAYLEIGHAPQAVSFRAVWLRAQRQKIGSCTPRFAAHENWPLRGLFWLSKDLFEESFRKTTAPDAEDLADIRNHLEHRYLQLHDELGAELPAEAEDDGAAALRHSLPRDAFAERTQRLLRLVRDALIYLSLAVHREEKVRFGGEEDGGAVLPMLVDNWEDDWKQ